MSKLYLDFETRSRVSLKIHGAYRYASHKSTQILCMAWAANEGPVNLWRPGEDIPEPVRHAVVNDWLLVAHNVQFEKCVWRYICVPQLGWPEIKPKQWYCTAAKAAFGNYSRSLEGAAKWLLPEDMWKDTEGNKAMQKLCKPGRNGEFSDNLEDFTTTYAYCMKDVEVERALDKALPDWPENEVAIWRLNEKINDRGVPIDRQFCVSAAQILKSKLKEYGAKISAATNGVITSGGQIQRIKTYINERGVNLDSLNAQAIEEFLSSGEPIDPEVEEILQFRQMTAGAAAKKYESALKVVSADDRIRGMFIYFGASMTGRFAGTKTQIHNMKKGADPTDGFRDAVSEADPAWLNIMYGSTIIQELGKNVRNIVCAPEGFVLLREDSSQIECRVLHWLAGNQKMLDIFRRGDDPYIALAEKAFNKKVEKKDPERQVGKVAVLGLGFGLGADRFREQLKSMTGIELNAKFAKTIVDTYRRENKPVVDLWKNIERASVMAVDQGKRVRVGKLLFECTGEGKRKCMLIRLPSGRSLKYHQPQIIEGERGVRFAYTSTFGRRTEWIGGLGTENCVQAVARDTLVHYMQNCEAAGLNIIAHVHDEIMLMEPEDKAEESARRLSKCFADKIVWAEDLPCASEGKVSRRYK